MLISHYNMTVLILLFLSQTAGAAAAAATKGANKDCDGSSDEGADPDDNENDVPAYYGRQRAKKTAANADRELVVERNDLIRTLTDTVANMAAEPVPPAEPTIQTPEEEALERNLTWGRLIAYEVNDLPNNIQGRFKLAVAGMACDAKEGIWRPI